MDSEVVESLIKEYEDLNPGIKIDYANRWPGGKSDLAGKLYQDELDRVLREGNPVSIPDLFMVQNTWVGNYENYAAAAPNDVIDFDTVKTAYYPTVVTDFANQNKVWGIPLWVDSLAVIYNKNMLASASVSVPPTDWVNFKQLALNLTQRSGGQITRAGFATGRASNTSFSAELFNLLLLQNGVSIVDTAGVPSFSTDTDSQVAYDFIKSFDSTVAGTWDSGFENDALAFLQGKVAMIVGPSWRYLDLLTFNDKYDLGINIGIAPIPQLQGQTIPTINWSTYWGNMVSKTSKNPQATWQFLNWLSQPAQLKKLNANFKLKNNFFGIVYPRVDMQQELQADQYLRVFNAAMPSAQSWYMVEGYGVKQELNKMLDANGGAQSLISQAENAIQQIFFNKGKL